MKIILPNDKDDFALLGDKKKNQNKVCFERFGERLNLNKKQVQSVFNRIELWLPQAEELIQRSFLTDNNKMANTDVIRDRVRSLK